MSKRTNASRQTIRLAILLATISVAALANQPARIDAGPKMPFCYCNCQHENGKPCTKMCELPQYADRWWATSCHKKKSMFPAQSSPSVFPESRKTNRKEQASL